MEQRTSKFWTDPRTHGGRVRTIGKPVGKGNCLLEIPESISRVHQSSGPRGAEHARIVLKEVKGKWGRQMVTMTEGKVCPNSPHHRRMMGPGYLGYLMSFCYSQQFKDG